MLHTHFIKNIPVYIDTEGVKMNDYLVEKITRMVYAIKELTDEIIKMEIYISESAGQQTSPRRIVAKIIFDGAELSASDSGKRWKFLLKHVQQRLGCQVEKRNEFLKRKSMLQATVTSMQPGMRA